MVRTDLTVRRHLQCRWRKLFFIYDTTRILGKDKAWKDTLTWELLQMKKTGQQRQLDLKTVAKSKQRQVRNKSIKSEIVMDDKDKSGMYTLTLRWFWFRKKISNKYIKIGNGCWWQTYLWKASVTLNMVIDKKENSEKYPLVWKWLQVTKPTIQGHILWFENV